MCAAVAHSRNRVDIEFLPEGLHDIGTMSMRERLKTALQGVDESNYDAVLFGIATCHDVGVAKGVARLVEYI
jgi:hypothetical protein